MNWCLHGLVLSSHAPLRSVPSEQGGTAPVCLAPELPREWNSFPYDCTETSPALQPGELIFDYFLCLSLYRFPIADIHLLLMELCLILCVICTQRCGTIPEGLLTLWRWDFNPVLCFCFQGP